jgi:hypothetical protein
MYQRGGLRQREKTPTPHRCGGLFARSARLSGFSECQKLIHGTPNEAHSIRADSEESIRDVKEISIVSIDISDTSVYPEFLRDGRD